MLIEDSPGESTKAVSIDIIRRAFELWNLPWNLGARGSATSALVSSRSGRATSEKSVLGVHDLPLFRVTVDKVTMGTGFNPLVTLFVTYTNKTERELFLGLCGARYERKTLLVDDLGDTFLLDSSNGISDICFAPTDPPLMVAPGGSTRVALVFNRHNAKPDIGTRFSLTSEHVTLTQDTSGKYRIRSKFGVSILEILSQ
jgi:hypothetical protein